MADKSTATVIGCTTWAVFNSSMTLSQRAKFLYEYQRLGGIIDPVTLPASAGLVLSGGKYKTHLEKDAK